MRNLLLVARRLPPRPWAADGRRARHLLRRVRRTTACRTTTTSATTPRSTSPSASRLFIAAGRPAWRAPVLAVIGLQYAFHVINHVFDMGETRSGLAGAVRRGVAGPAGRADRLALETGGGRALKVLVAGGTGAVGRPLVTPARGRPATRWWPRAAPRSPRRWTRSTPPSVNEAVGAARPEVIVNQLTAIPDPINPRKMEQQFEPTNRLRREGTANLMAAASEHGVRRVIAQSIAFAYAPTGGGAWTEEDRLFGPRPARSCARSRTLERQTLGTEGVEGVVLRYGFFYGPGTTYAPRRSDGAGDPQAPVPDRRQGHRHLLVHPCRRRRGGHGRRARSWRAGHLQRGRRRPRPAARVRCRCSPRRSGPSRP